MTLTTKNGYMTLKIELQHTEITRTIVVPECMTLTDLNDAVQCVMGWEDAHLWKFEDGRKGPIYELPHADDFAALHKRLSIDSNKMTLGQVFPKRGAKLTYVYDFGDNWTHLVTRMADPKIAEIACVDLTGPDGLEDIGGQGTLDAFISAMQENPNDEEWADVLDWAFEDDREQLREYLKGDSAAEKTAELKEFLAHVKVEVPPADEKPKKMLGEKQARTLGSFFATCVSRSIWEILEDAFQHGGTCEFEDYGMTISTYLQVMFEGLKIKDGAQTSFCADPSKLTVPKKWRTWYAAYGKDWKAERAQFDIMESYALSAVHLYGVVKAADLYEIMLRYDPGLNVSQDEVMRYLGAKAIWSGIGYRIDGDRIVDDDAFPLNRDNVENAICGLQDAQKEYPRWYPETREKLFAWEELGNFERTPEVDRLERVLKPICTCSGDDFDAIIAAVYDNLARAFSADFIYQMLVRAGFVEKMSVNRRQPLIDAIERWSEVIRQQCLNGHALREIGMIELAKDAQSTISRNAPCPCGSGKKYKMCCGKDK